MKNNYVSSVWLGALVSTLCFPAQCQTVTTFNYTGAMQSYTVPAGVTSVLVDVIAASGGYSYAGGPTAHIPGDGGRVEATLTVTPGSTLNIFVGGEGETPTAAIYAAGGFNGGGVGGTAFSFYSGGGGGGASDIRVGGVALTDRIVVAGGGAGCANDYASGDNGGHGGGLTGQTGFYNFSDLASQCGHGGTPSAGGAEGTYPGYASGMPGVLGIGGAAGIDGAGGGGGGGYYGGGGGAWAGGGGGSSYTDAVLCSGVVHTQGYNNGDGMIVITELCTGLTTSVSATDVCEGDLVTLSAASTTGGTVTWDGGVVDGVPFAPPIGITTYTATSDDPLECIFSVDITVNPVPTVDAGSDVNACEGETVTLNGSGADTYVWDGGVTDGVPFTPPAGTTTYNVTGTVTASGCENTDAVDVTYTMVDEGVTAAAGTLTSDQAGASYQWIDCSDTSDIAGETSQSFTPAQNGDYAVIVTVGGCSDTSACTNIGGAGFDLQTEDMWAIYPNPANAEFVITGKGIYDFSIVDLAGHELISGRRVSGQMINVASLSSGVYFVYVSGDFATGVYKLVKQ